MYYQHQQQIPQQQPPLATNAYQPMQYYPTQQPASQPQQQPIVPTGPHGGFPQVPPQPPQQNFDSKTVQQQPGVVPNHMGYFQQHILQQQQYGVTPSPIGGFAPPTCTPGAGFPPALTAGFPPGPPQLQKQRLDPEMVPSIIQVVEDDRSSRSGLFPTGFPQAELPPLTTTEFIAQDQGNSNPKFIRSTIYSVPQSSDITKATHLPLSLALTPFAKLHPSEVQYLQYIIKNLFKYPPPLIDLGDIGPVRCQRCKAYMCPFMEFIDGGRKFRCPFCKANSTVQDAYFAHLDHSGRRTDIQHRPELFLGSYDFVATKQYCKNGIPPKQPAFIFMLDVSYNSVRTGLVELFCSNIVEILRDLPKDNLSDKSTMLIGLATYDQSVHFYNLNHTENAEMLVVNDVSDIFVPFVEGFFVKPHEAEKSLTSCLREIVNNFYNTRITEVGLGPVIQAGLDALKNAERSGKLFIFHSSLPTLVAPGQLKNREERKLLGTDKEKTILTASVDFYGKLGEECVKYGCSVDIYLFPNAFIDVASIAPVVATTGGSIYKYQYFDADQDGSRFLNDLRHGISREIAFDVMLRLRTSTGLFLTDNTLRIHKYGNLFKEEFDKERFDL
uniref:Protein transport protein Sec24C n=1 Tax=Meloidogyne hapla TaxID=6305 RepID=A0A1I8B989_MELHA